MNAVLLGIGYAVSQFPWSLVFLATQCLGIRLYTITNREDCVSIQKRVARSTHTTENGRASGYAIGPWYFASISNLRSPNGDTHSVWLVTTQASYDSLVKRHECIDSPTVTTTQLQVYERMGNYSNVWYKIRRIDVPSIVPRANQQVVLEAVQAHHKARGHTVVFLHGPPGSGKSIVGVLLANLYAGTYCNTLKPWQPGDSLGHLYCETEPTKKQPLVVLFDEFDRVIDKIHVGIQAHGDMPTTIGDKTGWNRMLDEMQLGLYPNTILVLTSNKGPEYMNSLDAAYIREGRVDLTFELK